MKKLLILLILLFALPAYAQQCSETIGGWQTLKNCDSTPELYNNSVGVDELYKYPVELARLSPAMMGSTPAAGGASINYGNTAGTAGTETSGNANTLYGLAFTTGSNAAGYSINSATIYVTVAGGPAHLQFAVFPVTTPTTSLCQTASSTVDAVVGANTDTSLAVACSAVTLAASTGYYIFVNNNNAANAYGTYTSGTAGKYNSDETRATFAQTPYGDVSEMTMNDSAEFLHLYITVTPK